LEVVLVGNPRLVRRRPAMSFPESELPRPNDSPDTPDKPEPEVDPDSPLDPPEDTEHVDEDRPLDPPGGSEIPGKG
jgi:hypothetical protein